jgi:hypothetical protein
LQVTGQSCGQKTIEYDFRDVIAGIQRSVQCCFLMSVVRLLNLEGD